MLELELKLSGAVTFSVITKTQIQEKASEEMVCTTLEPVEAEGGGNAMLPSRPITVLTVCLAATYSYIFRGGARQGTVQIWRLKDAAGCIALCDMQWDNRTLLDPIKLNIIWTRTDCPSSIRVLGLVSELNGPAKSFKMPSWEEN